MRARGPSLEVTRSTSRRSSSRSWLRPTNGVGRRPSSSGALRGGVTGCAALIAATLRTSMRVSGALVCVGHRPSRPRSRRASNGGGGWGARAPSGRAGRRRVEPPPRALGEHADDEIGDALRHVRGQLGPRDRRALVQLEDRLLVVLLIAVRALAQHEVRRVAGEHLEADAPERVEIGGRPDVRHRAPDLLGGHEPWRAAPRREGDGLRRSRRRAVGRGDRARGTRGRSRGRARADRCRRRPRSSSRRGCSAA